MTKLVLDRLYVDVAAADEAEARAKVEAGLAAMGRKAEGEGWRVERVLADPGGGRFGVEVAGPDLPPPPAWLRAHQLGRLLGDAHVEPEFAGEVPLADAAAEHGDQPAAGDYDPVYARVRAKEDEAAAGAPQDVRWHLERIRLAEAHAWLRERGLEPGAGVVIGHPDTGFTPHPTFAGDALAVERGRNLLDDGAAPRDPMTANPIMCQPGHGTKTASLMVARGDVTVARRATGDQVSMLGIAPAATVVPFRVTDSVVLLGWQRRLAEAIEDAVVAGCQVVSMSIGGLGGARLDRAIRVAEAHGVIVVAAAGNGVKIVVAPACHPLVVACAASTWDDKGWPKSSEGAAVDITAPGAEVWGAAWDGERAIVELGSGTSFATAIVAAAAALWLSAHATELATIDRGLHPALFRAALRATARPVADLPPARWGGGILDCAALVARPASLDLEAAQAEVARTASRHDDTSAPLLRALLDDLLPDSMIDPPAPLRALRDQLASLSRGLRAQLAFALTIDPAARASWRGGGIPWLPPPPWARPDTEPDDDAHVPGQGE